MQIKVLVAYDVEMSANLDSLNLPCSNISAAI